MTNKELTVTVYTPQTKKLSMYELTRRYWNGQTVEFNMTKLIFKKEIGCKPSVSVFRNYTTYDYLSRSNYFDCLFEKF